MSATLVLPTDDYQARLAVNNHIANNRLSTPSSRGSTSHSTKSNGLPATSNGENAENVKTAKISKTRQVKSAPAVCQFPLAYTYYRGERHLHPERLPSAKRERPVSVRLLDFSKTSIENVKVISGGLKQLCARGLKVHTLPERMMDNFNRLERLDFSGNRLHDYGIPETMKGLVNLVELRLNYNKLTRVPACLKSLGTLSRLDLSHNKIDSLKGMDKVRGLTILVIDHNMLTSIFPDIATLRRLEILHCANNNVREIERDVRHLKSLKEVDLSCNKITVIPGEIVQLPSLEILNISRNRVNKLGMFTIKVHHRHYIHTIDLSENSLTKLPEQLLLMCHNLDVSHNRIKVITGSVLKKIHWKTKQTINLNNNPITHPPQDVCYSGISSIIQFFHEAKIESKVHQGVKVIVVGQHGCGKTSLVQSMLDQQPRLETSGNSSAGIDSQDITYENGHESSNELQMTVWDFCGHPMYNFPHYIFYDHPSVTLIVFDIAGYRSEMFYDVIGYWIDWIMTRSNRITAVLVGTKTDMLSESQTRNKLDKVLADSKTFFDHRKQRLEDLVKQIENRPYISSALSDQLKHFVTVLNAPIVVYPVTIATSSKNFSGFENLKLAVETIARNATYFPNVDRIVPTFWLDVQQFLEDKGNSLYVPVMTWAEYEQEVTSRFGMKTILVEITSYLHETGKIIWFRNVSTLKNLIFIRPSWLFDVFKNLIRPDMKERLVYSHDEHFIQAGYLENRFETARNELLSNGVIEIELLRALLGSVVPIEHKQPSAQVVKLLTDKFNMALPISSRPESSYSFEHTDVNKDEHQNVTRLLLPCYRQTEPPESILNHFGLLTGENRLVAVFKFPYYCPPGIFEIFCVRLSKLKHNITIINIWKNGIYGCQSSYAFKILAECLGESKIESETIDNSQSKVAVQRDEENQSGCCIRLHLRWQGSDQNMTGDTVWSVFLALLMEVEDILARFAGVLVSRHMVCPFCAEPSFFGEWLSPKETQNMSVKPCEACGQLVDTGLLVQPRQKRRDDIMKKLAELQSETGTGTRTHRSQSSNESRSQRSMPSVLETMGSRSLSNLT